MKVLVVGAGSIGKRHVQNLRDLGCKGILMPYSKFSGESWNSRQDQLREFDGAVVATATQHRLEIICSLASAGLPLYIEKPLSSRSSDIRAIAAATERVAARSMVGFMMRYHRAFRSFASLDLSSIYAYSFEIGHDVRKWRKNREFSKSYAARADGGGVLLDLCHELDMALCLFPASKKLSVESLGHPGFPGVDFSTRIALSDESSRLGIVAMDYLSPISYRRMSLRGTDVNLEFDFIAGQGHLSHGEEMRRIVFAHQRNDLFLSAMRDFLNLVKNRPSSISNLFPRLDMVMGNCALIAKAREARQFTGMIAGDFP